MACQVKSNNPNYKTKQLWMIWLSHSQATSASTKLDIQLFQAFIQVEDSFRCQWQKKPLTAVKSIIYECTRVFLKKSTAQNMLSIINSNFHSLFLEYFGIFNIILTCCSTSTIKNISAYPKSLLFTPDMGQFLCSGKSMVYKYKHSPQLHKYTQQLRCAFKICIYHYLHSSI